MDDNLNHIIISTLNVKDMGTYYTTENKNNAFTKSDIDNLVRLVELQVIKEVFNICTTTNKHFQEVDEISPEGLKSTADKAIHKIIQKLTSKFNLKKSNAL